MTGCAWVTLATNDTYCLGALVLAHSLRKVSTRHGLAIIVTPQVSPCMREQLSKVFDLIHLVDVLDSQDATNLALMQRPDLGVTFTKIHCWNLVQYSKCVFLDADTLVMQNCDELMDRQELSAAPDPGWPDCFNSGVFVFVPSQDTFKQLIQFASTHGSFDGGDQGLLNMYFNDWPTSDIQKHLSFLYNMCSTSTYTYLPALKYYGANIKIVHFIGANKPWLLGPGGAGLSSFTQAWWDTFQSSVVQHLSREMSGLAGALGSREKSAIEEQWRKQNWEQGNIDFTGKDSFENIWQKIMDAVNKPKAEAAKPVLQKADVPPPVPKEIASQAVLEKEKADIPASSEAVAVLPELPKEEQKPLAPLPSAEVPKPDLPIPMPPPTPETAEIPKVPESPKPSELGPLAPAPPAAAEPPKPAEVPKAPESLPTEKTKEELVVAVAAAVAQQQTPAKVEEPTPLQENRELPNVEDILKGLELSLLAEQQKDEQIGPMVGLLETALPTSQQQKKPEDSPVPAPAEVAPLPELTKADAPLPEIPPTLKTEETKAQQTQEAPKEPEPPKVPAVESEVPKAQAAQSETPAAPVAQPEAPKTPVVQPEAPIVPVSQPEAPTVPVPQPEAPTVPPPQPETPTVPASKPVAPIAAVAQPEIPLPPVAPQPEAPKAPAPQPPVPQAPAPQPEAPKVPETPKSPEAPKVPDAPTAPSAKPEVPKAEVVTSEALKTAKQEATKPDTPATPTTQPTDVSKPGVIEAQSQPATESVVPILAEIKELEESMKQKSPPKEQGKEAQKPAKPQAPQPPPKNGKQKKGQQPEPTSAHPLAETPVQFEAGKEEQKVAAEVPLTPPTSPDSLPKEPEPVTKAPESQPATPTVIAPTPPVSPLDASKVEDPLSAQIRSEEVTPSSTGAPDVPVPPKRKGKGNEKQPPQKSQNNGNKGKGKK